MGSIFKTGRIKFLSALLLMSVAMSSYAQVTANAGTNTSICLGSSLTIGGAPSASGGTAPYTYSWSPATGLSSTTVANPTATPTTTTTYTLVVTDNLANTASASIIVNVKPIPDVTAAPSAPTICHGQSPAIVFNSGVGGTSFSWTVNQSGVTGASASTGAAIVQNLYASTTSAGTATYTVTPTANGCTGTPITVPVTVNPAPIVTGSGVATVCSGGTANYVITSDIGGTYTWYASDNPNITGESTTTQSGSTINNTLTSSTTTPQNVNYTVSPTSTLGCQGSFYPITITVNALPAITSSPSSLTICSGAVANLSFSSNVSGTSYTYTVSQSGVTGASSGSSAALAQTLTTIGASTGTATYTITPTAGGCTGAPITVVVTVNPTPTVSINNPAICTGNSTTLTATASPSGGTYSWSPGGLTSSSIVVAPVSTTTYTCSYTKTGCSNNGYGTVTVNPLPSVSCAPISICVGASGTLTASGASTYSWAPGIGLSATTGSTVTANPAATTTYTITGVSSAGCANTTTVTVTVNPLPSVSLSPTNVLCAGGCNGTVTSSGGVGGDTYLWSGTPSGQGTSTIINLCPGTYNLTVTNAGGCSATTSATITEPAALAGTITSQINVSCFGGGDGAVTLTATGGTSPYTYSIDGGSYQAGNIFTNMAAGVHTAVVLDANGCTAAIPVILSQPSLVNAIAGPGQNICAGTATTINAIASGGTPPYSYNWNDGTSNYPVQNYTTTPAASTSFTLTATDANGCVANDYTSIAVSALTDIYGHVTYSGGSLSSGANAVVLYKFIAAASSFDTVQITTTDGSGDYHFAAVPSNNYLIKVFNDTSAYPLVIPTYFGNQFLWDSASILFHDCIVNDTANIVMMEAPAISGPGHADGVITEGTGFDRVPGDPIPGVDVKLGKNPGSQLVASGQTNSSGQYSFNNLPVNAPGENYVIYVDIPGLERDSTYTFVVDGATSQYIGLNYEADSASVYPTQMSVGINQIAASTENKFSVYPNPAKETASVEYSTDGETNVSLSIYDVLGVKIAELSTGRQTTGKHICVINTGNYKLCTGVYFIMLSRNGQTDIQRLIITE